MDLRPSDDQRRLTEAFADLYGDLVTPDAVREAEPLGHLPSLWSRLLRIGAVDMAVASGQDGEAITLLDLALVAERHGGCLAPAPLIEAQVAARLLARLPGAGPQAALAEMLAGKRVVTIAVRPASAGSAGLVPAGAIADDALVLDGDRLLLVPLAGRAEPVRNLGCLPLADVAVAADDPAVLTGPEALALFGKAVDEWRVLTAAALSGLATRALEIGVAYVKERKAFGRPVGAFQSVAHRLADRACEVDGCELLVREAAWAADADPGRFGELAALALGFAAETARDTTYDALHFHGGYGFMLEYPVQLYFRRARSWAAVLEEPAASFRTAAARAEGEL
ncbi:acyl-CoA dehydrogenase family protein [Actinocorallia sp. A-T 12471]|uniref:acyl-CoA dehydrogenase family protein n=1 Tax=Actinocorallia sp. A-T 12471 TaxID=3089813 RepID=UPI0029D24DBF|nr:acyl-CoA dehydrogenase family protein [Actinocorallia sp. A-T 12471]MDX6741498.1 acyl-CoA dehydrogenase family protein [Actinocorallia sp. A-T 12471]